MARGSIERRTGRHGHVSYRCRYDTIGSDGRRRQRSETVATKKAAESLLAQRLRELDSGSYRAPSAETVAAYLDRWLSATPGRVRPATVISYRRSVGHLARLLGLRPLVALDTAAIDRCYRELSAAGHSPASVRAVHTALHVALKQAVRWNLLPANPATGASLPRQTREEMRTWSLEDVRTFLVATADDPWAALYRLALLTGMRRGELLALRWADVDLDRGTLAVRRTATKAAGGGWTVGPPKTRAGQRQIALSASVVTALRVHRSRQLACRLRLGPFWQEADLVFPRGDGRLVNPPAASQRFPRLVARLGIDLPRLRFHDLRHTAATLMLAEGVHPKIVQERLGHSSIAMTLDLYSHVTASMQQAAADRLDAALGG